MEWLENIVYRIFTPILIGWIFFRVVEYMTNKITLKNYCFDGVDLMESKVRVVWYNAKVNRVIDGVKYSNNKYYFKIFTQHFKSDDGRNLIVHEDIVIDTKDRSSYDTSTIVAINKKDISIKCRFKLIIWLILELIKNKVCSCRNKILPRFLIEPYVFTDTFYLNMENIYKLIKQK